MYVRVLEGQGIIAKVRKSRGQDIDAACGQLANKNEVAQPGTTATIKVGDKVLESYNAAGLSKEDATAKDKEFTDALKEINRTQAQNDNISLQREKNVNQMSEHQDKMGIENDDDSELADLEIETKPEDVLNEIERIGVQPGYPLNGT
jgi:hypothetical protein